MNCMFQFYNGLSTSRCFYCGESMKKNSMIDECPATISNIRGWTQGPKYPFNDCPLDDIIGAGLKDGVLRLPKSGLMFRLIFWCRKKIRTILRRY